MITTVKTRQSERVLERGLCRICNKLVICVSVQTFWGYNDFSVFFDASGLLHNFLYKLILHLVTRLNPLSFFPWKEKAAWLLYAQIYFDTKSFLSLGTKAKKLHPQLSVCSWFKKKYISGYEFKIYCGLVQLQGRCVCCSHRSFLSVFILRNNNKNMVVAALCPHLQA